MFSDKSRPTARSPYETSFGLRSQLSQLSSNATNISNKNQSMRQTINNSSLMKANQYSRSFNLSLETSLNQSVLNQSALISETSHHTLRSYGSQIPVLVIEAITSEVFSISSLSVKISSFGWAWLVCGRRLFVWKYKQTQLNRTTSCSCYELQLPPSDLSHKADLVCVFENNEKSQSVPSTMAVSPEGIIRFWPNIAYEGHSIETIVADLQGQECTSLTDIQPLGCILGTTTSSLVHITVNNIEGQNAIVCRTLKVPQGMLAGFGRKVSSFIFGAMPATQSSETKQLIKVVRNNWLRDSDPDNGLYIWVLSSYSVQKWQIIDQQSDRLIEDIDLERHVKDAFLDKVWNRETTHPNQLRIWAIDIGIRKMNQIVLLVAGLNADVSNQLYYAVVTLNDKSPNIEPNKPFPPILFTSFTVLRNHTVCYSEEDEEQLLNLHLLSGTINSQMVYIYNTTHVLCLKFGSDEVDLIDFNSREDGILGAGICDGFPLLFLHKDALISIIPHKQDINDMTDVSQLDEDMPINDDNKVAALKKAFVLFRKGDQARSELVVKEIFPLVSSVIENETLDETVVSLSIELCDEIPHSDPRWAESSSASLYANETITASVIMTNQLEEKLRIHRLLIEFLKVSNLWQRLMSLQVKGSSLSSNTRLLLGEHAEKLIASLTLRKLHNDYNNILDAVIRIVLHKRNATLQPRLTPQDLFYRETTRIDDLIWALIEYQTDQINNVITNSKEILKFLLSVSNILITLFQEICHYRQTQGALYEWTSISKCEYIPWTSTTGPNGVRTSLLKQFDSLVNFGIESSNTITSAIEEDIQLKGAICQKIVELADIILDGFVCQLKSIDSNSERFKIVERSFESCRFKCIEPLMKVRQFDRAAALAEKYFDFDILILLCEELKNQERLQRYIVDFASKGFAEHLFKWYLKEGKQGKMLATTSNIEMLNNFLANHSELHWLHQIHLGQLQSASLTLKELALNEHNFLGRKKTLFSLSKLSAIAAGETNLNDIDSQLELILYQENLSPDVLSKFNLDFDTMKVLSPQKLIEIYISESNSNVLDFKKALDLTEFVQNERNQEKSKLLLKIWGTAIARDSWKELDTDNPLESIRNTLFFQIIEQSINQGYATNDLKLPPFEELAKYLKIDKKNNTCFLIKALYEHLKLL